MDTNTPDDFQLCEATYPEPFRAIYRRGSTGCAVLTAAALDAIGRAKRLYFFRASDGRWRITAAPSDAVNAYRINIFMTGDEINIYAPEELLSVLPTGRPESLNLKLNGEFLELTPAIV
jgi:hypothetical protein